MVVSAAHVPSELESALKITPIVATSFCCNGGCSREIDGERERMREEKQTREDQYKQASSTGLGEREEDPFP